MCRSLGRHASAARALPVRPMDLGSLRAMTDLELDACTCEKATDGGYNPANEIDFTTK